MNIERIFEYILYVVIFICLLFSVVDSIEPNILPERWYIPAIFSILFAIFHYIFRLPKIEGTLSLISGKIQASGFRKFTKPSDYYDSLELQLQSTENEILLTHIRNHSPSTFSKKSSYFTSIDSWLKKHPDGMVKRISAAPNEDMFAYCQSEYSKANNTENYYFRCISSFKTLSMFQVAIFDRKMVFITIPGGAAQQTRGIFIDDPEVVDFCIDYFNNLWEISLTFDRIENCDDA